MFSLYIPSLKVTVSLNSSSGDKYSNIVYSGNTIGQEIVKARLSMATGAFGHIFSTESTTPIDLHYAIKSSFPGKEVKIIKGAEMVENYSKGLPKGVCS